MNYEDRTDLQPPDSLVSSPTLRTLFMAWPSAKDKLPLAFDSAANPAEDSVETKLTDVIRPEVELEGAPPQAWPVGLAAARAGYRLGGLMVGQATKTFERDDRSLAEAVHQMYVYGLYQGTSEDIARMLRARLADLITDVGAPQRGDFEEHASLCFSLGLAIAVVEFDRALGKAR